MKKKFLFTLLCGVLAVLCAIGLVACGGLGGDGGNNNGDGTVETPVEPSKPTDPTEPETPDAPDHVHTFSEDWETDGIYHWHESACNHDVVSGKSAHEWDNGKVNVAASCKTAGETLYTCKTCKATKTETVAKTDHDWEEDDIDATCLTAGYHIRTCKTCQTTEKSNYVDALGHNFSEATCTSASVCSRCKQKGEPAFGHAYAITDMVEASCTVGAKVTYSCKHSGCNEHYETITGEPAGHDIVWEDKIVNAGKADICYTVQHVGTCDTCGYVETGKAENITTHIFSGVSITEKATCAHAGEKSSVCATCNYMKTESYTDEEAHSWNDGIVNGNITTFTCNYDGAHTRKTVKVEDTSATVDAADLKNAGSVQLGGTTIELDESAKSVLNGKQNVDVAADALTGDDLNAALGALDEKDAFIGNGTVYNFTMTADNEPVKNFNGKVTVRIPYELQEGENPDEITVWYVNGSSVEEVQARYTDGFAVFETEHFSYYTVTRMTPQERCAKYGHAEKLIEKAATCLVSGYKMTVCTRCGENEKEILPATGHDWNHTETAATCVKDGETVYTCGNCDATYSVKVPALNHKWSVVEQTKATCESSGKTVSVCTTCGEKHEVTEPQKAHSFKNTVTEPTCTEGGYTTSECVNCGTKSVHSETKALGHNTVVKTDAPTCVETGLKYEYCERCEKLIDTIEVIPAAGHKLANGICSVCGEGCKHNYVAGTAVDATCTEKGYTLYTCSVCSVSYKGNLTDALGHAFGVKECSRCHAPNPAQYDYYVNLIQSFEKIDFAVKFTDFSVKSIETNLQTNEDKITFAYEQLDVMEMYVRVEKDGTLVGGGRAELRITEDYTGTFTLGVELAVYNEVLYLVFEDGAGNVGIDAMKIDVEYIFREMSGGSFGYDDFREMYLYAQNDLLPLLGGVLSANSETISTVFGAIVNNLFIVVPTADGYKYTLNLLLVSALNEKVHELKINGLFDYLFGEGSFDKIEASVTSLLDKTVAQVIQDIEENGLSKDDVFAAANTFIGTFGDLFGFPEDFDLEEIYEYYINEIDAEKTTVADLVAMALNMGGGNGGTVNPEPMPPTDYPVEKLAAEEDGITAAQVKEMVREGFATAKESTVYELLAQMMGSEENEGASKDELYEMAKEQIDKYVEMIGGILRLEFVTDKEGFLTGANIDVTEVPVAWWGGTGYEGKTVVSGGVSFIVGGEVKIDAEKIADMVGKLVPVYEKNGIVEAYSNYTKSDKTEYGIYATEVGREMRIHTDVNGNVIKVVITEEYIDRYVNNTGDRYSKYFYYDEYRRSSIREYSMLQGTGVQISQNYCGDWSEYNYLGYCTSSETRQSKYIQAYLDANGALVIVRTTERESENQWNNSYYGSVSFYYNNKTKAFRTDSPHEFELDEKGSKHECEGYDLYVCKTCGQSYKNMLGHLGETEYDYELLGDDCEDGVLATGTCDICHKVTEVYESNGHRWDAIETEYALADYGSVCGGSIIVRSCPCGKYTDVSTRFECDFQTDWLNREDTDNISWYEHTLHSCVVTNPLCTFAYEYKYYIEYDEACRGTEHRVYVFGQMKNGEFVPSGKQLEFTRNDGISHNTRTETVEERLDDAGCLLYHKTNEVCRRCGNVFGTNTAEYTKFEGVNRPLIVREHNTHIDSEGTEKWSLREFDYSDGEYCSPAITYTDFYGENSVRKEHHYNGGFYDAVVQPTCTQSGLNACEFCGDQRVSNPHGHDSYYDEEKGVYVCYNCGLEGNNSLNGDIMYEDMSTADEYKVGYYMPGYHYFSDKEHQYSVTELFMVNVAVVSTSDLEGDGMEVTLNSLFVGEPDEYGSGIVTFSVAEIAELIAGNATFADGYMVRLTFVPISPVIGGNDYAITLDAQGV